MFNRTGLGQEVQKQLGQHGIPVYNVTNACATGATAFARCTWRSPPVKPRSVSPSAPNRWARPACSGKKVTPQEVYEAKGRAGSILPTTEGILGTDLMPALFSHAAMDYVRRHPHTPESVFAEIAEKNHRNSVDNPLAMYQKAFTLDEIQSLTDGDQPRTPCSCADRPAMARPPPFSSRTTSCGVSTNANAGVPSGSRRRC